jgi:hypothetical protein
MNAFEAFFRSLRGQMLQNVKASFRQTAMSAKKFFVLAFSNRAFTGVQAMAPALEVWVSLVQ